jgi:hypothetical protein
MALNPATKIRNRKRSRPLTMEQTMFIGISPKEMTMTILLHFVSIFASLALLALSLTIIQVMIGTYRAQILAALTGTDQEDRKPAVLRVRRKQRSLLLSPA